MKIIGICNLTVDNYFIDKKYYGSMFGGTVSNILANLSSFGFDTHMIGVCGDDLEGDLILRNLDRVKVNIDNIVKKVGRTRRINVSINDDKLLSSKYRCPVCQKKISVINNDVFLIPENICIDDETIVLFENISLNNIDLAKKMKIDGATTMIDIGYKYRYKNIDFYNCFDIVQLNEKIADYLIEMCSYKSYVELNKLFNAGLIVVTLSEKGAIYVCDGKEKLRRINDASKELDSSGAGDIFYSILIREFILNKKKLDKKLFDRAFEDGVVAAKEVVKNIGAIKHLLPLEKIKFIDNCNCGDIK